MVHHAGRALAAFLFFVAVASANTSQAQTAGTTGGVTFGAFGSGAFSDIDFQETTVMGPVVVEASSGDIDGAGGGLLLGYDLPIGGGFFVGAEGDIAWGDWKVNYNVSPTMVGSYDIKYILTIRGRAGMEVADGVVVYGTAGYLHAMVEHGAAAIVNPVELQYDGWTAGAGGEMNFLGVTAFVEWLYLGFGSGEIVAHNERHDVELSGNTVKAGFKLKLATP